ncbi:MAG: hypothetical protein AAGA54_25275 [Myxococcota bacterium]
MAGCSARRRYRADGARASRRRRPARDTTIVSLALGRLRIGAPELEPHTGLEVELRGGSVVEVIEVDVDEPTLLLEDGISANVLGLSLLDQQRTLSAALQTPVVIEALDELRDQLGKDEALMVSGFISVTPGSMCRDLGCRDTSIDVGAFGLQRGYVPIGTLGVPNFEDDARDEARLYGF